MRLDRLAPAGNRSRSAFTLVELMVAMALSLFLMTILTEAFAVSMDTFRGLRAIGDMQDTLRNAVREMGEDLSSPHFEGGRKMSDNDFWMEPRREGFFYMKGTPIPATAGGTVAAANEGNDANGVVSSRATDHMMHFTVRRQGYRPTSFFTYNLSPLNARCTAGDYSADAYYGNAALSSQWAQIAYFLRPMTGTPTPATPESLVAGTPVPLYNLYRAQILVIPYRDSVPVNAIGSPAPSAVANNSTIFLSPNDLAMTTVEAGRGFYPPTAANPANRLDPTQVSLVCTNVVSFQIRLLVQQRLIIPNTATLTDPVHPTVSVIDMQNCATGANAADPTAVDSTAVSIPTWANPVGSSPVRIMGVQIRLRIYDPASGLARQNTLVQSL
jgi:prepilin-type N-terminal cleavage/methylation domain-containing protein